MQFASDQLLPGPALTHDEYRTRHRRDADDRLLEFRERGTRPDERGLEPEAASQERDLGRQAAALHRILHLDRKSTRLNSSHSQISYAVFCLKKKKNWSSSAKTVRRCVPRTFSFLVSTTL